MRALRQKFFAENRVQNLFFPEKNVVLLSFDEVGRGCLAGPVVAGVSAWRVSSLPKVTQKWVKSIKDSKKLNLEVRQKLFKSMNDEFSFLNSSANIFETKSDIHYTDLCEKPKAGLVWREEKKSEKLFAEREQVKCLPFSCLGVQVGMATASEIDAHNIWGATQLAMARAANSLFESLGFNNNADNCYLVVVDGNNHIRLPSFLKNCPQIAAVKGDSLFISIGTSSVAAKVVRDEYMVQQSQVYPHHSFELHKGYATQIHRDALRTHDITPLHRRSFLGFLEKNQSVNQGDESTLF